MRAFKFTCAIVLLTIFLTFIFSVANEGRADYVPGSAIRNYQPLEPLPVISQSPNNLAEYLNSAFKLGIGLAIAFAVFMIIWGGFEYVTTESLTGKSGARERIENALWGLLIALAAYIILYTLNPELVALQGVSFGTQSNNGALQNRPNTNGLIDDKGTSNTNTDGNTNQDREPCDYIKHKISSLENQIENTKKQFTETEGAGQIYENGDFRVNLPKSDIDTFQKRIDEADDLGEAEYQRFVDKIHGEMLAKAEEYNNRLAAYTKQISDSGQELAATQKNFSANCGEPTTNFNNQPITDPNYTNGPGSKDILYIGGGPDGDRTSLNPWCFSTRSTGERRCYSSKSKCEKIRKESRDSAVRQCFKNPLFPLYKR